VIFAESEPRLNPESHPALLSSTTKSFFEKKPSAVPIKIQASFAAAWTGVHAAFAWDEETAASINAMPSTPSSIVGKS
jgi:hypothetical protein